MGSSSTKIDHLNTYVHPRFGTVKRIQQNQHSPQFMGLSVSLQSVKMMEEWNTNYQILKCQQIPKECMFLPKEAHFQQINYCGGGGILTLKFQDYFYSLHPQLKNRRQIKRPFNQRQLMYLFYTLVRLSAHLQKKGMTIGDVKPQNIIINEDGYVKIISTHSMPLNSSRIGQQSINRVLWAPQTINNLYHGHNKSDRSDQNKLTMSTDTRIQDNNAVNCEAFAIGMTILQAGTLMDTSNCYTSQLGPQFNQNKLKQLMNLFQQRYSHQFYMLVRDLLQISPRKRGKTAIIYSALKPYQNEILNLQEIVGFKYDAAKSDREEKVSIKRMVMSNSGNSNSGNGNGEHDNGKSMMFQQKQSIVGAQNHYSNQMNAKNSQHFLHPHFTPKSPKSSSSYIPTFQAISQSIYIPSPPPPPPPYKFSNYPQSQLMHSLPANLIKYENPNQPKPTYITQNSMMINRSVDNSYK